MHDEESSLEARAFGDTEFHPEHHAPNECERPIYEFMGIRYFRMLYLSTLGWLIEKFSGQKFVEDTSADGLKEAMEQSVTIEARHLLGAILMTPGVTSSLHNGNITNGVIFAIVNLLVNIYPIMLQRYNRGRIIKIFRHKNVKKSTPSKKTSELIEMKGIPPGLPDVEVARYLNSTSIGCLEKIE